MNNLEKWRASEEVVSQQTDKHGRVVDDELKELIVGLHVFGIKTVSSNFGHIKESKIPTVEKFTSTPFVSVKPELDKETQEKHTKIREKIDILKQSNKKEELGEAYKEYRVFLHDSSLPHYQNKKKLIELVKDFYQNRHVTYGTELVVRGNSLDFRLENLDETYRYFIDNPQEEKLKEYQNEFIAFGKFLKKQFFEQEDRS